MGHLVSMQKAYLFHVFKIKKYVNLREEMFSWLYNNYKPNFSLNSVLKSIDIDPLNSNNIPKK